MDKRINVRMQSRNVLNVTFNWEWKDVSDWPNTSNCFENVELDVVNGHNVFQRLSRSCLQCTAVTWKDFISYANELKFIHATRTRALLLHKRNIVQLNIIVSSRKVVLQLKV